ncbi:MAG: LAGLIDADG family homing endonuclease [Candidatus Tenebribacter davisii]|nr:LAGLIDADG family homing endonuclease [Candidatus Tenebribacter davisii]
MIIERSVSVVEEKRVVTGLITSTQFIKDIIPVFQLDYFVNSYLKTIATWCVEFYAEHSKAPYKHISDIFDTEVLKLKESDSELISELLKQLSEQYDEESINVQYLKDCAVDYFRKRELEIVVNNVSVLKEKGEYDEAEDEINRFKKVTLDLDSGNLINLGDVNQIMEIYRKREEEDKNFFQLPGDLGRYLGNYKRGDVVGYYAPAKRGKCVEENSLVYLADGRIMKIKDVVRLGISGILCMDKKHNIVKGKITDWMYSGEKDEYEITTKSGRKIITSKDHKFYTPTGWKRLKELKVDDRVAMSKFIPNFSDKFINPKKLKILAYLIADGHLANKTISFTKYSTEIMDDFINNLPKSDAYRMEREGKEIRLHVGKVTKFIKSVGLKDKLSGDKFIPDIVMQSNNESMTIFLNTLFICDGSIWMDRNCVHVDYSTKSHMLAQQILCCLNRFNIFGKLREKIVNGTTYYEIIISSNQGVLDFVNKIGFSFHKAAKAKEFVKDLIPKRDYIDCIPKEFVKEAGDDLIARGLPIAANETFRKAYKDNKHLSRFTFSKVMGFDHKALNNDLLWDSIISIKRKDKVKMYDISVEDNHNFISDGFIVHNSFTLVDHYKHAVLQKRKTIFWSVEMTQTEITPRIMKAFQPMIEEAGDYPFPVFDCKKNQSGDCSDRASGVIILDGDEIIDDPTHIPCTKCKGQGIHLHEFDVTIYSSSIFREADDIFTVRDLLEGKLRNEGMANTFNKYARLSVHPKYTLTYDKMMRDIEIFEAKDGFIPDIFIIDYVDILDVGSKFDDYRAVDEAWKLMARMAGEFNALVITATQANKEGHKATALDSTHQAGFYGKNQHVNMMCGLNQTPAEKAAGILKYGITEARSQPFIPGVQCICLQDIKAGQVYLDSYYKGF